jgi:hypothetical protein
LRTGGINLNIIKAMVNTETSIEAMART